MDQSVIENSETMESETETETEAERSGGEIGDSVEARSAGSEPPTYEGRNPECITEHQLQFMREILQKYNENTRLEQENSRRMLEIIERNHELESIIDNLDFRRNRSIQAYHENISYALRTLNQTVIPSPTPLANTNSTSSDTVISYTIFPRRFGTERRRYQTNSLERNDDQEDLVDAVESGTEGDMDSYSTQSTFLILDENEPEVTCPISHDVLVSGDIIRTLPCGHIFKAECVENWLRQSSSCPVCRQDVRGRDGGASREHMNTDSGTERGVATAEWLRTNSLERSGGEVSTRFLGTTFGRTRLLPSVAAPNATVLSGPTYHDNEFEQLIRLLLSSPR